jgi:hypothetical protein
MNNIKFAHGLIKGRIAEIIFAQMLRGSGEYQVIEFGYEKTLPEITHLTPKTETTNKSIEAVRRAPDFAILNLESHDVHLIEVKYMNKVTATRTLAIAKTMEYSWKQASLFIASPTGFYYDTVLNIIKNSGKIPTLKNKNISPKVQEQYLALLNEFIKQT